jgi:hypothetical protein
MRCIPDHKGISISTLLAVIFLLGSNEAWPINTNDLDSAGTEPSEVAGPAIPPDSSEPEPQNAEPGQGVDTRVLKSLDLKIHPAQKPTTTDFGAVPDADWLKTDSAVTGLGAGADSGVPLPGLFDGETPEKPVSVKGKLLIDEGGGDVSTAVDGAGFSLEFKTD